MLVLLAMLCAGLTGCVGKRASPALQEPARPLVVSGEAAQRLAQRLAAALNRDGPFTVEVNEQELTSYLAREFEGQVLDQVRVWITPEGLNATVRLRAENEGHVIRGLLFITPNDGTLKVQARWATYDGFRLPRFVLSSFEQMANASAGDALLPYAFTGVAYGDGSLTLSGQVR